MPVRRARRIAVRQDDSPEAMHWPAPVRQAKRGKSRADGTASGSRPLPRATRSRLTGGPLRPSAGCSAPSSRGPSAAASWPQALLGRRLRRAGPRVVSLPLRPGRGDRRLRARDALRAARRDVAAASARGPRAHGARRAAARPAAPADVPWLVSVPWLTPRRAARQAIALLAREFGPDSEPPPASRASIPEGAACRRSAVSPEAEELRAFVIEHEGDL